MEQAVHSLVAKPPGREKKKKKKRSIVGLYVETNTYSTCFVCGVKNQKEAV